MGIGCISQQTRNVKSKMAEVSKSRIDSQQASFVDPSQISAPVSKASPLISLAKELAEQTKQGGLENRLERTKINQIIQQAPSSQEIDQQNERISSIPNPHFQADNFSIKPQHVPVQDYIIRGERSPLKTMNQSFNNSSRMSNRTIDYGQFNIKLQPLPVKSPPSLHEAQEQILEEEHINQISINLYRTELKY